MSKKRQRREKARLKALQQADSSAAEHAKPEHEHKEHAAEHKPVHHAHTGHETKPKGFKAKASRFYETKYKALLIIPFLLLFSAICQIGFQYATTGDFISKGVSLKGGITVTLPDVVYDSVELEEYLNGQYPNYDIDIRTLSSAGVYKGLIIDADITGADNIKSFMETLKQKLGVTKDDYNIEEIGSSLGESFFFETITALLIAFLCMGIVVFLYFRVFVPSIAVILAAFSDIIVTLAIANLLGMKISTAGIAAFLMLVGYSVDTDILLSTKVLKRKEGTALQGVYIAMKTGFTMTMTTVAAVIVGLFVSQSEVLKQIMTILLIGLLVDLINTWIQNAGLIRWYEEKKKVKE